MAREMVPHPSLSLYSNIRSKTWQSRMGLSLSFLRLTDSLSLAAAVPPPMAVFKPRLKVFTALYFSERRCFVQQPPINKNTLSKGTLWLGCDLCKMVTGMWGALRCCDSNETGSDGAHLSIEWSFQIKTIIIIEAWPWWQASSPFIVPSQKYYLGSRRMIFENISVMRPAVTSFSSL